LRSRPVSAHQRTQSLALIARVQDIGVGRLMYPDLTRLLLCKGYSEQCVDIGLWDI
jgi:hypothetical protein